MISPAMMISFFFNLLFVVIYRVFYIKRGENITLLSVPLYWTLVLLGQRTGPEFGNEFIKQIPKE